MVYVPALERVALAGGQPLLLPAQPFLDDEYPGHEDKAGEDAAECRNGLAGRASRQCRNGARVACQGSGEPPQGRAPGRQARRRAQEGQEALPVPAQYQEEAGRGPEQGNRKDNRPGNGRGQEGPEVIRRLVQDGFKAYRLQTLRPVRVQQG